MRIDLAAELQGVKPAAMSGMKRFAHFYHY